MRVHGGRWKGQRAGLTRTTTDTTLREDIGARPASVSEQLATLRLLDEGTWWTTRDGSCNHWLEESGRATDMDRMTGSPRTSSMAFRAEVHGI